MPNLLIHVRKTAIRVLAAAVLLPWGPGTQAAELEWRCWYNAPEHVSCAPRSAKVRASYRFAFMHIPLHNIPFDMEGVRNLAQAVACGTRADCRVIFTRDMPTGEELDQMMDPLWAQASD